MNTANTTTPITSHGEYAGSRDRVLISVIFCEPNIFVPVVNPQTSYAQSAESSSCLYAPRCDLDSRQTLARFTVFGISVESVRIARVLIVYCLGLRLGREIGA